MISVMTLILIQQTFRFPRPVRLVGYTFRSSQGLLWFWVESAFSSQNFMVTQGKQSRKLTKKNVFCPFSHRKRLEA